MSRLRPRHLLLALLVAAGVGCYEDPQQKLDQMQQLLDLGDALNELGMRTSELQGTMDSLRTIIARQDTVIYRMANVTGVPYPLR